MVAYGHVARPWFSKLGHQPEAEYHVSAYWRWKIHAVSMIVFLPTLLALFVRKLRHVPHPQKADANEA